MSEYLEFSLIEEKPIGLGQKTKVIGVWSKKDANRLGIIKWYGPWRQYAFFPEKDTLFNIDCLANIQSHIKGLR